MKQWIIIKLIILFLFSSIIRGNAQEKDRILSNGFSIKAIVGLDFTTYNYYGFNGDVGYVLGAQFGNRWYSNINSSMAFGAMINWLEVTVIQNNTRSFPDVTFLSTGPIFTYKLNTNIGIDGFYNIRPSVLNDDAIQVTHGLGLGFRYKVIMFDLEYVFGNTSMIEVNKMLRYMRFSLGFKF